MSFDDGSDRLEGVDAGAQGAIDAGERTATGADTGDVPALEEGRYLYCLVRADSEDTLETTGVESQPVSLVAYDEVAAVVHPCDEIYDSADLAQVRRWLVRHQTVVDEAGDRFGTPIPFQFDTILRGDDDDVREWINQEYDTIEPTLSELADHWEYRVEVVETDPVDDEALVQRDDRLRELDAKIGNSEEGTAYLLEKQFDQRITQLRVSRRESLTADLEDRLADEAREVHSLERSPTVSLSDDPADETNGTAGEETLCRLTILAHEDDEGAIGSVLDDAASNDGLEIRFTGPWPPYTFAPELGEDASNRGLARDQRP
ncbi:gas vesicle protein GvpFL [Natrarchaeobius halalkaliphilus]|uniref:Gas vesicle protein GvpFL n=1 Tax=Natrarchaeobius halalkaliphilus TaxID=1679091 RepID=A0A3N6NYF8_9EURY|nr:GvpL/GvpF family gas vesicle protein [Natrarchaeobius halalkaliphilus]RQG89859.1 gas vesicle protein GvpFL [Natrarchaeobius halalkaliphilus]